MDLELRNFVENFSPQNKNIKKEVVLLNQTIATS